MPRRIVIILSLWTAFFCIACKENRPANFPKLYSVSVKILQDKQPLSNAQVSLYCEDSALTNWSPGGNTDENGIVKLYTHGYEGVPEGTFKVTVSKMETTGSEKKDPTASSPSSKVQTYFLVEKKYRSQLTTPLTLDIHKKGNVIQTLDVGKGIRETNNNPTGL